MGSLSSRLSIPKTSDLHQTTKGTPEQIAVIDEAVPKQVIDLCEADRELERAYKEKTIYEQTRNKPNCWWAVVRDPDDYVHFFTLARTKAEAVRKFEETFTRWSWRTYKRKGYRVARVEIEVLT